MLVLTLLIAPLNKGVMCGGWSDVAAYSITIDKGARCHPGRIFPVSRFRLYSKMSET